MSALRHLGSVILCIDYQATTLALRKLVLRKAGYRVLTAAAREALEIFRGNHVDVVLMEHGVRQPDGSALVAKMKMLKPEVPLAIYSADWAASPDEMQFADIFITKLVSVDELLRAIERLLRTSKVA